VLESVSVVVILGAIVATIARAVLVGDRQPATGQDRSGSEAPPQDDPPQPPRSAALTTAARRRIEQLAPEPEGDSIFVPAGDVRVEGARAVPVVLDTPMPWWKRLRSIVALLLLVVVIGLVTAAVLGLLVVGGASLVDSTLE
jgi:hypothetical protein